MIQKQNCFKSSISSAFNHYIIYFYYSFNNIYFYNLLLGGAAEKCGNLQVGDELLLVNETDVSSMSRFEAWSVLKKLPEGITISLTIKR